MRRFEVVKDCPFPVKLPERKTEGSAGYDFYAPYPFAIGPGQTLLVKTWVKAKMPKGEFLKIWLRSSWGVKRGMELRCSGIIDSDYYGNTTDDGNIMLAIHNFGEVEQRVEAGERIAQGIFIRYETVDEDKATGVRTGGYGSTGK